MVVKNKNAPIVKYTTPTNLSSFEEYGTVWITEKDNGTIVWMQTSKDSTEPKWIRIGDIIEHYIISGKRYEECMRVIFQCHEDDIIK
jgi:hypothetical protein